MSTYLSIAQIVISVVLIVVILLQAKGAGFSGVFGAQASVFRTRRGLEKTLFQFTIVLSVIFVVVSVLAVRLA